MKGIGMAQTTCRKCGAVYEVRRIPLPLRDKDRIDCEFCGEELIGWNGGVMYTAKLIKTVEPGGGIAASDDEPILG
jgi:hypothetical protein